jgi:hypothetical protein
MNERVEKLFDQAKVECFKMGSKPATTVGYDELEKFAQLIVRECVSKYEELEDAVVIYRLGGERTGKITKSELIKEHFGVAE